VQVVKKYLELIDTNTSGPRYDVTPLFADFEAFSSLVDDMVSHFDTKEFDLVAGVDALGFILGAAVAMQAKKGMIAIRKGGKLPVETQKIEFVDYSGTPKSLEIRRDTILDGMKVLLIDEWIETGTQVNAAIELIEFQKGIVAGVATINIDENEKTQKLKAQYKCYEAWNE
jgi:adenine phosphoribosyltransferase